MTTTAVVYDAVSGVIREELPWETITYTHKLNDVGQWRMALPLSYVVDGFEKLGTDTFEALRSVVCVMEDGIPQFAGLIEQEDVTIGESGDSLTIGGPDAVLGYLKRRTLITNASYLETDQFVIAEDLILSEVNTGGVGATVSVGIGLHVNRIPDYSGVERDRNYYGRELHNIYKLIEQLSAVENGFDFTGEVLGSPAEGFDLGIVLGYPELRRETGFVLELGKNVQSLTWRKDSSKSGNRFSVKWGSGPAGSFWTIHNPWPPISTMPTYDVTKTASSTDHNYGEMDLVEDLTRLRDLYSTPQVFLTLSVNPDDPDSQVGSFRVGDMFRVIARRGRVQEDRDFRVHSYTVGIDRNGSRTLNMTMTGDDVTS